MQVLGRLFYDASTLQGLARGGEMPDLKEFLDNMTEEEADDFIRRVVAEMTGKVCSAKIYARKP